jgi:hypothetical protein
MKNEPHIVFLGELLSPLSLGPTTTSAEAIGFKRTVTRLLLQSFPNYPAVPALGWAISPKPNRAFSLSILV